MNVLIIKNDGLGDLILTSGLISYLGKEFANVDLLTCDNNKEIATKIKYVNEIFYISRDAIREYSVLNMHRIKIPLKTALNNCKILRMNKTEQNILKKINSKNYDLIIVLRRFIRQSSLYLLDQIEAKEKLCMWEIPTNISYNKAKELSKNSKHITSYNLKHYIRPELEYYEAVLSYYLQKTVYADPSLDISNVYENHTKNVVALIISGSSIKIAAHHWKLLCQILNECGFQVLLLGGIEDISASIEIACDNLSVLNKVGQYCFDDYSKIFSNVQYIIGNDTGVTHFASLFHTKILVLLGGGTFRAFFPWRSLGPQHTLFHEMDCYNCGWRCTYHKKYECIEKIFMDRIFLKRKITEFLFS